MAFNVITFLAVILAWIIGHIAGFDPDEYIAQLRRGHVIPKSVRREFLICTALGLALAICVGFWGEALNNWLVHMFIMLLDI